MKKSFASLTAAGLLLLAGQALADDEPKVPPTGLKARTDGAKEPMTDKLALRAGQTLTILCQSNAFTVHEHPFRSSRGVLSLVADLDKRDGDKGTGTWRVSEVTKSHDVSFATELGNTCDKGCEMRFLAGKGIELWAPGPKPLNQLGEEEMLWLVTIDAKTMALKSSTFRGPAPAAFEKGTCEVKP